MRILEFALPPTQNLNASQWNIGCAGSQPQISCIGHVHFMFFCVDFICVGYPTQTRFQWNMDFNIFETICFWREIRKVVPTFKLNQRSGYL